MAKQKKGKKRQLRRRRDRRLEREDARTGAGKV